MAYITKEELEDYVKKYPEDETLLEQYINAAEEMVENYLGYSPEQKEYKTVSYGDNGSFFCLEAFPLIELKEVKVNEKPVDTGLFRIKSRNYLEFNFGKGIFYSESLYSISYSAGFEKIPGKIKTVALQLASLMWESEGGNLAVSSTTYSDNGSRVFNNFRADRFLEELEAYKKGSGENF